jgi:glyoxylase-like metal-dependent hydrolase (beta-lactamase superfamily II)
MKLRSVFLVLALMTPLGPRLAGQGPAGPAPAPAGVKPFEVAQLDPTTWYGRFGYTNCAWIDLGDGVLVIDTGGTAEDAKNLLAEIARTTNKKPVKWIAMTHLHSDSNDGFSSFLPTDATVFVNARASSQFAPLVTKSGKTPHVVGVGDRISLLSSTQALEIGAAPGSAHTDFDLYVFSVRSRTAFVGDLVTTGHCPMMSDSGTDPKGWLKALDRLDSLGAEVLVPTRGNATKTPGLEIDSTRQYISSMQNFLAEKKKQNAPEARVSGELAAQKLGDKCPRELAALNALSIYRRMAPDGTVQSAAAPAPAAPAPKKK